MQPTGKSSGGIDLIRSGAGDFAKGQGGSDTARGQGAATP